MAGGGEKLASVPVPSARSCTDRANDAWRTSFFTVVGLLLRGEIMKYMETFPKDSGLNFGGCSSASMRREVATVIS